MLQPATAQFLSSLANNNSREWFDANRDAYDTARHDFEAFVEALRTALVPLEPALEAQTAKSLIFRIFRDVRFSNDKTPYKKNFSAYYSRAGRKAPDAGYYIHLQPGASFAAAGVWMPEGPLLKAIRQEIDYSFDEWTSILDNKAFVKQFGKEMEGERLKKVPQGYTADNPAAEFLKQKSFIVSTKLPDEIFTAKDSIRKITAIFSTAKPMIDFLNRAQDQ